MEMYLNESEAQNHFDSMAIKISISIIAISLAVTMTGSVKTQENVSLNVKTVSLLNDEQNTCPIVYSAGSCRNGTAENN